MQPDAIVDRYLRAVTDRAEADFAAVAHTGYTFVEHPNLINPAGSERDLATSLAGLARSRELLAEHSFEVLGHVVAGDVVASRLVWRGTLAADGRRLTAHVSQHTTIRDGKVWRTESFDCYEPF